jgi:hypothetical protein
LAFLIDFKGGHHNPENIKDTLPEFLKNHMLINGFYRANHMHIYVEGYKTLAWAIH